jgi:mono/diheme cytochrome c family protein
MVLLYALSLGFWMLAATAGLAQEAGRVRPGLELARSQCSGCHAVERGNHHSIRADAPAFAAIAAVPGMSGGALATALSTSHRRMPDVVLSARERADVIAYVLSLSDE